MIFRHLAAFSFVLLGASLSVGCGAGDGGVCQLNSDCASGLTCECKLGGGVDARGLCRAPGVSCTVATVDANVPDVGPRDAGSDAGNDAALDANVDASVDANTDAFTPVDAPAAVDVGTDAAIDSGFDANG